MSAVRVEERGMQKGSAINFLFKMYVTACNTTIRIFWEPERITIVSSGKGVCWIYAR